MGDVHLFDVASGKPVDLVIPRVNGGTAGGDLEWAADSKGFYYTRYPRQGERPDDELGGYVEVWFHQLGTPIANDRYELGKGFPKVAEIILDVDLKSGRILASVQNGDGGEFAHHVRSNDGKWTQITRFEDRIVQAAFGANDDLILLSRNGAPRGKLLHLSLKEPELAKATTIVPEGSDTLMSSFLDEPPALLVTGDRIYCRVQLGGPSEIRAFDLTGKRVAGPPVAPLSSARIATADESGSLWYSTASYLEPLAWHRFDPKSGADRRMAWSPAENQQAVDFSDCEVVRDFATSHDGTKVPVNIVRPKGLALDGSHPCVLTAYGGYGMSREPAFSPVRHVLLEQGVIFAEANIRGGGEFGEEWHRQGNLTRKQNVFDDFVACAQLLIEKKYTTPARLAIEGGSNGGLLMGAALTQHPELFKCVVSHVGIYDMLRVELSPNGAFNTTEFGTVKDEAQFKALLAYSPYHHVKDGTSYPAVLFLTGANDPRVDPMQSRKMTARLQAAAAAAKSTAPVLLRTSASSGHGMGTALGERIEQQVDVDAFLFHELGVAWKSAEPKKRTE
jgi:prolyl oligopeptidase